MLVSCKAIQGIKHLGLACTEAQPDVFPAESLKHVQEMFWEDSGLSDLDSNDEPLMDVHVISVTGRNDV